jgi:uncharacterized protein YjbI with pentapeptide repeats
MPLSNAYLTRADLFSANLQGAHIWAADGLTQEQIDRAIGDENTVLTRNLPAPQHWSKGANKQTRAKNRDLLGDS